MFGNWASGYLKLGISSFPVDLAPDPDQPGKLRKKPLIRNYLKTTQGTTLSLIEGGRFEKVEAIGIPLKKNRITVVDIDTPDPAAYAAAVKIFGEPSFVVDTPSGGKHLYYKNSGEPRVVRYLEDPPVDLLGDGYVVAAPSIADGAVQYRIVRGSPEDLQNLPPIKQVVSREAKSIPEGVRDVNLWRYAMSQARFCDDLEALEDVTMAFNEQQCHPPQPENLVKHAAASAWKYQTQGKNWFGTKGMIAIPRDVLLSLTPNESYLYLRLREAHAGLRKEFVITNDAAPAVFGMSRWALLEARNGLLDKGVLVRTHRWSGRKGDPHRYAFPDAVGIRTEY
jgi:hypothetical protein